MNERIKELEQQAMTFRGGIQMLDTEKFAELIVKECLEMSKLERAHYMDQAKAAKSKQAFDYEFNASAACLGVELRIKKHFGVEE